MKVLALDIGKVRTGIAYGSTKDCVAVPVDVVLTKELINNTLIFRNIVEDYLPDKFIVGLPKTMAGAENSQTKYVRSVVQKLNLEVEFFDERLSSVEAKRYLRDMGLSEKNMRGKIDKIAASIFLQSWLDKNKSTE